MSHISPTTQAALKTWAAQKRVLYLGRSEPIASMLGKIKSERVAAGEGDPRSKQKWPEVFTGDAFAVQQVIVTLRELPRLTVTFYYVLRWPWRVSIADQAREIGVTRRDFWRHLEVAEAAVETGLQLLESPAKSAHSIKISKPKQLASNVA